MLGTGINAWAQDAIPTASSQVIEPELERRTPEKPKIDAMNFEAGIYYGIISIEDFGSSDVVGVSLAYHVTEDFFFEVNYAQAKGDQTSFEKLSGGAPLLSSADREYNYYSGSVGWNVLPGEVFLGSRYAFNSAIYLIAGVGRTEFAGDNAFTINFGAGFRLLLTDWLAWHIDARDHLFDRDTFGKSERTNNIEFRTGITVLF